MEIKRYNYCDNEGAVIDDFSSNIQIYKNGKLVDKKIFNLTTPLYETNNQCNSSITTSDVIDPNTFFNNGLNYLKNTI